MLQTLSPKPMAHLTESSWGVTREGDSATRFTLQTDALSATLSNYGARILGLTLHGPEARSTHVALGYGSLAEYERDNTFMGAVVGRYANRIAHGRFQLDDVPYQVPVNNGSNALHGGSAGFDRKVWYYSLVPGGIEFTLLSPDGDMGFPGELTLHTRYTLSGSELRIDYTATTSRPTVLNITNHAYFNLAGEGSGSILNQLLQIQADRFTPVDAQLIPTGEVAPVDGTPFDFRSQAAIGARIHQPDPQLAFCGGYDHNFVTAGSGFREIARVTDPQSGRRLTVSTTEPGLQFYSGNFLTGAFTGLSGKPYLQHTGFCLETQHFPDSPNQPSFPSTRLSPGETWRSRTTYRFDHDESLPAH